MRTALWSAWAAVAAAMFYCLVPLAVPAQTLGGAAPATPSNKVRPTPRLPDGRVNLDAAPGEKGFWNPFHGGDVIGTKSPFGGKSTSLPTNLKLSQVPFQKWARDLYAYRRSRAGQLYDPHARCSPPGGIRFFQVPNGLNIVQQPSLNRIFFLDGENREWRRVAMDPGRKHPPPDDLNPSYLGDSIGHWEGDTLVVDTVGFNEKFWLTNHGLPHTHYLHLIERFTRVNYDTLKYRVTIDDKGAYTRPWSGGWYFKWQTVNYDLSPGGEIQEYFCADNERDTASYRAIEKESGK